MVYLVGHIALQNTLLGKSLSSFSKTQSSKYYFSRSYLHIVIEMAKMWSDVLVLGSGVKTKLYWHWVPLVRQTLTTGENPNLILLKADVWGWIAVFNRRCLSCPCNPHELHLPIACLTRCPGSSEVLVQHLISHLPANTLVLSHTSSVRHFLPTLGTRNQSEEWELGELWLLRHT